MQQARSTLRKIVADMVRREGADGPVMAWPLACGAKIAERTSALGFANGVLIVSVPDEAWRRQLRGFVPQYLAALNQIVAEPVNEIQFRAVHRQR